MEPEDSGQSGLNSRLCLDEVDRVKEVKSYKMQFQFSPRNFTGVQIISRKRRRAGDECLPYNSHRESDSCQHHHNHRTMCHSTWSSSTSSSPSLVFLLISSLMFFQCLSPVYSLPFESRGSHSVVGGGSGGSQRSQLDLLLDPVHQAEFGDDEPLESKRVVAKSVFDMVLRTPAPPTTSTSRCPPGTQSPFEGGPCIKKSTDPVALVDQSFLLDTLRGLHKDGALFSTPGGPRTKKRRPGRPGGSRTTTTPTPTTTTTPPPATPSTITVSPEVETSTVTVIYEDDTERVMESSGTNTNPVPDFQDSSTNSLSNMDLNVPSTLPTTTPTEVEPDQTGRVAEAVEDELLTHQRRKSPPEPSPSPEIENGKMAYYNGLLYSSPSNSKVYSLFAAPNSSPPASTATINNAEADSERELLIGNTSNRYYNHHNRNSYGHQQPLSSRRRYRSSSRSGGLRRRRTSVY